MEINDVFKTNPEIIGRKVSDEFILVHLNDDIADMDSIYTINEVGAFIWENINGKNTIQNIIDKVITEFEVKENEAKEDVISFFDEIEKFIIKA